MFPRLGSVAESRESRYLDTVAERRYLDTVAESRYLDTVVESRYLDTLVESRYLHRYCEVTGSRVACLMPGYTSSPSPLTRT